MVKYRQYVPKQQEKYPYPSRYGSHASMLDKEKTGELNKDKKAVLEDEHGYYVTDEGRIDSGLADPHRHDPWRLKWIKGKK